MRFIVPADSHFFFETNLYFPLESLLKPGQEVSLFQDLKECGVYNSWRKSDAIKKVCFNPLFAQLAHAVTKERSIRFAFSLTLSPENREGCLDDLSSVKPTIGALLISENGSHFIHPNCPFSQIENISGYCLIIAYARDKSVYAFNPKDPNKHLLKNDGYAYGDHLKNETNPLLFS